MGKAKPVPSSSIRRGLLAGLVLAAMVLLGAAPAHAVAGDLDPTFGAAGKALPAITGAYRVEVTALAMQGDGKIVCVGTYSTAEFGPYDFIVFRLLPGGDLDTGFGSGGWVVTDLGSDADFPRDVVIQGDGKIVVAGAVDVGGSPRGVLVRYTSGGALDTAEFGTLGQAFMSIAYESEWQAVALQTDGKIVAAGRKDNDFTVARYSTGGVLDSTFDSDGIASVAISDESCAMDVYVYSTGQILAAGYTDPAAGLPDFAAVRFNANGSPDSSFDSDGIVTVDIDSDSGDQAVAVAVDQTGNIYLGGYSAGIATDTLFRPSIARLTYEGALDTTFGTGGKAYALTDDPVYTQGMVLDPQGWPVLSGPFVSGTYQSSTCLVRFTDSGTLDHGFGVDGQVLVDHGAYANLSSAPILDAQGRLLLGGQTEDQPMVTRLQTDDRSLCWGGAWWWSDPTRNDSYLVDTGLVTIKATAMQDIWNCQRGAAPMLHRSLPAGDHWSVQASVYVDFVEQDTFAGLVLWNGAESGSAVRTLYVGLTNLSGTEKITIQGSIPEQCAYSLGYTDYSSQTLLVRVVRSGGMYSFYNSQLPAPNPYWELLGTVFTTADFDQVGFMAKTWDASNQMEAEFSGFGITVPGVASSLELLLAR